MKHIKKMKIDIDKKNFEIIPSVQYDSNTRFLHINLTNGSIPFDLTGCSVKISGTKQDGTAIFNNCTIINAKKGFVEVELTEQINAIPGTVKCELKIYSESGVLTTKHFDIEVTAPLTASKEIVSSNEFKALTDALKVVQGIDNKADKEKVEEKFGEVYEQLDNIDNKTIKESVKLGNNEYNVGTILDCTILKLIGNGGNTVSGNSITWNNKENIVIKNINFKNMSGLYFYNCNNVTFENCTFYNFSRVGIFAKDFNVLKIVNCSFEKMGMTCSNEERYYLGGAVGCNTGNLFIFENNKVKTTKGLGAIQPTLLQEIQCNYNSFDDCWQRAFSYQSNNLVNGSVSYNNISNCGVNNTSPLEKGVGCNGIFSNNLTNLKVNYNTIINCVENGIEIHCLECCYNTIINTGLLQETLPTPSTEGIYLTCKKCVGNVVENSRLEGLRLSTGKVSEYDALVVGNVIKKGSNSITTNAIGVYGKGYNKGIISNNVNIGYDNLILITENNPTVYVEQLNFNANTSTGNLLNISGHYPNFNILGENKINNPFLTVSSITTDNILLGNSHNQTDTNNGLQIKSSNEYGATLYKDFVLQNYSNVINVEVNVLCDGNFKIRFIPYVNGKYDYGYAYERSFRSNGVLTKAWLTYVCNYNKIRVEIQDNSFSIGKYMTIKYFSIQTSKN